MAKKNRHNTSSNYIDQAISIGIPKDDLKTIFQAETAHFKLKKTPKRSQGNPIKMLASAVLSDLKTGKSTAETITNTFTSHGINKLASHWDTQTQERYLNIKSGTLLDQFVLLDECIHQAHHTEILDIFPQAKSVDDLHLNGMLDPALVPTVSHMGVKAIITKDFRCKDDQDICWVAMQSRYPAHIKDTEFSPHVIALNVRGEDVAQYLEKHKQDILEHLANDKPCGYLMIDESGAHLTVPPLAVDLKSKEILSTTQAVAHAEESLQYQLGLN